MDPERRRFLQLLGAGAAAAALPGCVRKALVIPAHHRTGTIADVEHIVFFMKENRAFDHYFGALRGVRGFGDPHPVRLANGDSVWAQPGATGPVLPFHPDASELAHRFLEDLPHDWNGTHAAWHDGRYDGWVRHKGATTMAHLTREDIPFHYALADAFTVCDAYHCSLLGPTQPNRMHMWTGWVGNDGAGGGPLVTNPAGTASLGWTTYPERLERAGVTWKVYQDVGHGMNAHNYWGGDNDAYVGNYGCNSLLFFNRYQDASSESPLYRNARTGTRAVAGESLFAELERDVAANRLPQVSWIISPEAYSEHPNWPAGFGAWYTARALDALTSNPEVWSKTVLFLTYDENDGFFDHVVPPTPPMAPRFGQSTVSIANEIYPGNAHHPRGPYGLGARVPMTVISPWSKGGWVSSEVFDHTSLLRFAEQRFGVRAENITPWRRAVCGDLTATLDFATPNAHPVALSRHAPGRPPDNKRHPSYKPPLPAHPRMPTQEPGQRPARAVPYALHVEPVVDVTGITLALRNTGTSGAALQIRSADHEPRCQTLGAHAALRDRWDAPRDYALEVHGPNGFYRAISGNIAHHPGEPELHYDAAHGAIELRMAPREAVRLTIRDAYAHAITTHDVAPGEHWHRRWPLASSDGWYDLDVRVTSMPGFRRQFAGHVETGTTSMTDPQLGSAA